MISTEIYVEDYKLDLLQDISTEFTYTIDDITDFGSKNTSFSKTISLSGTAINNQIFGFVFDLGNANFFDNNLPNVNYNFNASKAAQCKIFIDKVQIFKGTLRILEIVIDGKTIEYQCSVFGELGGFITSLGNSRLEDLDFSAYDHTYNVSNITNSWDSITGAGYYYPLIDFGNVSTGTYGTYKKDFQVSTFRPALYIAEYIDKIFAGTDYTYSLDLEGGDLALFNRLIIPHNQKVLSNSSNIQLKATPIFKTYSGFYNEFYLEFDTTTLGNFTLTNTNTRFTYIGTTNVVNISFNIGAQWYIGPNATLRLLKNGSTIDSYNIGVGFFGNNFQTTFNLTNYTINVNDYFEVRVDWTLGSAQYLMNVLYSSGLNMTTTSTQLVPINYNENIKINNIIPKGIFQRDFFLSICKMFNLYVYDDKWIDKKIIIKPYIDFYPTVSDNSYDWSNKIDRSKPLSIKPMSELNARYYQYKYATDNDYYNENYSKKYTQGYGDIIYDTEFDFSKNTETTDIIFAPSVLFQQTGTDKIYPAIYKLSNNNTKEDVMDSVIRIMQVKKKTSVASWSIMNGATVLSSQTTYGYAGHLDDPNTPANDINFGVPKELSFTPTTYPTTNLFNAYHSEYIAEITDKDSKLLTCSALLNTVDILNLDFSKYIWIDGVLFRLNKVDGFNPMEYNTTKISLLKVIETTY